MSRAKRRRSKEPASHLFVEPAATLQRSDSATAEDGPAAPSIDLARIERVRGSARWAAYGDALGFISELTDEAGLRRRTRGEPLDRLMPWRRRVGGRSGVSVPLPAGCYSDDTQLRLAVSRAVTAAGFDVEAFARVELPVWLAYSLGGGRSTKAAATNLARPRVPWFANTFEGWITSGGNGAAMRVQPHVWSARRLDDPTSYLPDVVRNALVSHAHPAGLLGAVFHALCVAQVVHTGSVPSPELTAELLEQARVVPDLIADDPELSDVWLPVWERAAGTPFAQAWDDAVFEAHHAVGAVAMTVGTGAGGYEESLKALGLFDAAARGSGVLCAIAALGLAWSESEPGRAMRLAANALGSDTDTIATMAGALLGGTSTTALPEPVMDLPLIEAQADRMSAIASGSAAEARHVYPDLLHWAPPRTQADALVATNDGLYVLGLGPVAEAAEQQLFEASQGEFQWQWVGLTSGQTLLIKRRRDLRCIRTDDAVSDETDKEDQGGEPMPVDLTRADTNADHTPWPSDAEAAPAGGLSTSSRGTRLDRGVDLDRVMAWLRAQEFSDSALGYAVRRVARDGTSDQLVALAALLRSRLRR